MKTALVTGGAGFIGSHLCERLVDDEIEVVCVDNFITGNQDNVGGLLDSKLFRLVEADASGPPSRYLPEGFVPEWIFHLASPASPRGYQDNPVETYSVNSFGTHYLAEYASKVGSRFLFASTSEVYGDPKEHPQKEGYWGNVHIRGPRASYDVSKRFGEMVQTVWERTHGLDIRTIRIFNTYGPRMDPRDGRVIPNFVTQALGDKPITIYGDGLQTRSFCFVDDLVSGIMEVMSSQKANGKVYNLGNPDEYTMLDFAEIIRKKVGSQSKLVYMPMPEDDPKRRKPDISAIEADLGWKPTTPLDLGLEKTIAYFEAVMEK